MTYQSLLYAGIALALAGLGLLQLRRPVWRKLGLIALWLASGVTAASLTQVWWLGALVMGVWLAFPVSELVVTLSRLRLPRSRQFIQATAPQEDFPELRSITEEMEALGYRRVDDCRLEPDIYDRFYRLFVHPTHPQTYAFIAAVWQGPFGFQFSGFASEDRSGDQWLTWNYPLSNGLKSPPTLLLFRPSYAQTIAELHEAHHAFLQANGIRTHDLLPIQDKGAIHQHLMKTMTTQLDYNRSIGILRPVDASSEQFCYSWRGALFVISQVMRDLVRL